MNNIQLYKLLDTTHPDLKIYEYKGLVMSLLYSQHKNNRCDEFHNETHKEWLNSNKNQNNILQSEDAYNLLRDLDRYFVARKSGKIKNKPFENSFKHFAETMNQKKISKFKIKMATFWQH